MFSNTRLHRLAALVLVQCLILSTYQANALPLIPRQAGPTSVMTVQTTDTVAGLMTETCVITLTPITDVNGQPAVEEVRRCTITMNATNNGSAPPPPPGGTTSSVDPAATSTASDGAATTSVDPNATSTASDGLSTSVSDGASTSTVDPAATSTDSAGSASSSATDGTSTAQATGSASVSVTDSAGQASNTASGSVSATDSASQASGTASSGTGAVSSSAPTAAPGSPTSVGGIRVNGLSTIPATAVATGANAPTTTAGAGSPTVNAPAGASSASVTGSLAAAEQPSASETPFTLPGKKLSVLPIGLGVFAGISVIALIVVGLVTYERTKYRKAFRQRKLAESGAGMGYGGMAQRT